MIDINLWGQFLELSAKVSPTISGKTAAAASSRHTPSSLLAQGSEKYAGGGVILIMTNLWPNEEAEFIENEMASTLATPEVVVVPMANGDALQGGGAKLNISLDDTAAESDVPEAFEVSDVQG
jgi:26S proteasome regulatory subunit N2